MALTTRHLTRRFGDRVAVDDVSMTIERGRLTGFVGANGAGKTTVMRMILGVLAPNAGGTSLDGKPLDPVTRRSFGYMPEERGLYPKMRLREQMIYFASLHGLSKQQASANADALLEVLGLTERAKDPIEDLSLGNQQRAQVAVSLVHEPTALILDEPFSGLDPLAVDVIVSVLHSNADRGIPVLLSSHQLDVVERLCDDLVIIAEGKIKAAGSIESLQETYSKHEYLLKASGDLSWLTEIPNVHTTAVDGGAIVALDGGTSERESTAQTILQRALSGGTVHSFAPQVVKLSEIFREIVEAQPSEGAAK